MFGIAKKKAQHMTDCNTPGNEGMYAFAASPER